MRKIGEEIMGSVCPLLGQSEEPAEVVKYTLETVWQDFIEALPLIGGGLAILAVTWAVTKLLDVFGGRLLNRTRMRHSQQILLVRLTVITLWIVGFLIAAMVMFPGMTPTRALAGLGVMSLAIGLAFKDIFKNFFAGILILWRFPFQIGDYILCQQIEVAVEDITIRNTMLRQVSGELVVLPNAMLFENPVSVLTNLPVRRTTIQVSIVASANVAGARRVMEEALNGCDTVDKDRNIEIFAQEFAPNAVNFEVTWWTGPTPLKIRRSKNEVVEAVHRALGQSGIDFSYPEGAVVFKQPLEIRQTGQS